MTQPRRPIAAVLAFAIGWTGLVLGLVVPPAAHAADVAHDPATYYAGTDGLTGAALEAKLHAIVHDHTFLSYDQLWSALQVTDRDPDNPDNIIDVYSGTSLVASFWSALIAVVIGTSLGFALVRHPSLAVRRALSGLTYVLLIVPETVIGVSLLLFYAVTGLRLGLWTLVAGITPLAIAVTALIVRAGVLTLDRRLEDAAARLDNELVTPDKRAGDCKHLTAAPRVVKANTPGECEDCLREGTRWVHLRLCLTCGHVGCCDSSPEQHATRHYDDTHHPVMRSIEPGEAWRWCFVDEQLG